MVRNLAARSGCAGVRMGGARRTSVAGERDSTTRRRGREEAEVTSDLWASAVGVAESPLLPKVAGDATARNTHT
jgi:hypothetical protein